MSYASPNFRYDRQGLMPDYDRTLAPVPLRRGQPVPGYGGFTSRIDGTVTASAWSCMCGGNPSAPAYGIKDRETAIIDPTRAFLAEVNCTGEPNACTDPAALTYNVNANFGEQLSCVYAGPIAREECLDARTPATGCNHVPYRHSHY